MTNESPTPRTRGRSIIKGGDTVKITSEAGEEIGKLRFDFNPKKERE